ncbi:uncharacterized protein LOC129947487 isoform X2 [Eupeodes corollae]|nr:uncharacterized protein LOC129947487 isoform X2 [Eupeodes corollae]
MLSNRDLSKTMTRNVWLLMVIITVVFITVTSGAKNQTKLKNSPTTTEAAVAAAEVNAETSSSSEKLEDIASSTELEVKEEPFTSVWAIMYDWWNWMIGGYAQNKNAVGEPRTFGAIRRLQMALIPMAFKFGFLFAMVMALVFLAMKTVVLLKLLLVMNAAAIFAKLILAKSEHHYQPPSPPWAAYNGWHYAPPPPAHHDHHQSWPIESSSNKEVHLHVHGGGGLAGLPWQRSDNVYTNTNNVLDINSANELNNQGPLPYVRSTQNQANSYYVNGNSG